MRYKVAALAECRVGIAHMIEEKRVTSYEYFIISIICPVGGLAYDKSFQTI